jgi:hypothetical protein
MAEDALKTWHRLVRTQDPSGLKALLAEDAVFYSPVVHSPQRGKKLASLYLGAAFQVFFDPTFRYVREIVGPSDAMLEFETELDGVLVNGVDLIKGTTPGNRRIQGHAPAAEGNQCHSSTNGRNASIESVNTVTSDPSIERTFQRPLRALWPAAHVERYVPVSYRFLNSGDVEPYSALQSGRAVLAWFGFGVFGVALSTFISEVGSAFAAAVLIVANCGALTHATLLRMKWLRRMQGGRIVAIAVGTLALVAVATVVQNGLQASQQPSALTDGIVGAVAILALPVLVGAFLATQYVERTGT